LERLRPAKAGLDLTGVRLCSTGVRLRPQRSELRPYRRINARISAESAASDSSRRYIMWPPT
jgi:hypothetical protein